MKFQFLRIKITIILLLVFMAGFFISCDVSYSRSATSTKVSWTNGDGYKKISHMVDGNEKTLVANQGIQLEGGAISGYEKGLVIKLKEERDGTDCEARLEEVDGVLKLIVEEDELIREFYEDENAWLGDFLSAISEINGTGSSSAATLTSGIPAKHELKGMLASLASQEGPIPSNELKKIISALQTLSHSSEREGILNMLVVKELEAQDQVVLIESILNDVSFSSSKTKLLLKFIAHQKISGEAKEYLLDHLNELSFSSEREKVLKALVVN